MKYGTSKVAEALPGRSTGEGGESVSHETIVRRLYEEVANKANHSEADKLIASDCSLHFNNKLIGKGAQAIASTFTALRVVSPDLQWKIDELIVEKDNVWTRHSATHTHEGKSLPVVGTSICRIGNEKVTRWDSWGSMPPQKPVPTEKEAEEKNVRVVRAHTRKEVRTTRAQGRREVRGTQAQRRKETDVTQAQGEKEVRVIDAQGNNAVAAIDAQGHKEARIINAQRDRETSVIKEQLHRPPWVKGLALVAVCFLGFLLIAAGYRIAMVRAGELANGWAIVITAFVAAVAMVAVGLGSISNRGGIVLGPTPPAPAPTPEPTSTPAPTSTSTPTSTTTANQASASLAGQEPTVLTAVAIAAVQVFVIAGPPVDEATQAAIVGGLTALGGIFIRGRVSPVQTPVVAK